MHHDAIIIGGSFAGLSAATYLARGRRSVRVIDAGKPRNRFAEHSHGFFAQDGSNPLSMLETAKAQVEAYPTVTFTQGKAVSGSGEIDNFAIELDSGEIVEGRRLILAFGISDELPDIPGLAEHGAIPSFIVLIATAMNSATVSLAFSICRRCRCIRPC